jgi:hypothetical protein
LLKYDSCWGWYWFGGGGVIFVVERGGRFGPEYAISKTAKTVISGFAVHSCDFFKRKRIEYTGSIVVKVSIAQYLLDDTDISRNAE